MSAAPDDLADLLRRLRNLTGATRETLCQAAAAIEALQRQLEEARAQLEGEKALAGPSPSEWSGEFWRHNAELRDKRITELARQLSDSREAEERMRAALEAVANECDPDDPEWHFPAEGRRACWDIVRAAFSSACEPVSDAGRNCAWQPIETAPRDGRMLLVCWAGSGLDPITSRWLKTAQGWTHPYNKPAKPPTHWMPLPAAPETAKTIGP